MWPFNKFKKRPFTHNPEDFILKIVPAWFSSDYVQFDYSANGGKTWKTIHHASPPTCNDIDYNWEWERLSYSLGYGIFDFEKEKFSSYQKILDFEKNEENEYHKGKEDVKQRRKEAAERKKEAYLRANSNH